MDDRTCAKALSALIVQSHQSLVERLDLVKPQCTLFAERAGMSKDLDVGRHWNFGMT